MLWKNGISSDLWFSIEEKYEKENNRFHLFPTSTFLVACSASTDVPKDTQTESQSEQKSETETELQTENDNTETEIVSNTGIPWDEIKLEPTDKITVTYEDDEILSLYIIRSFIILIKQIVAILYHSAYMQVVYL